MNDDEKDDLIESSYYKIFDIEEQGFECTVEEVARGYKKAGLLYHPDKIGEYATKLDNEVWVHVQNGYECLIDIVRRKRYHSTLPFDDSVPKEKVVTDENFYKLFGDCFVRNA